MKIMFVCEGNTCRSPMAEALLRKRLQDEGIDDVEVSSAGIWASNASKSSELAVLVVRDLFGIDISGHRSSILTLGKVQKSDLVLTMTQEEAEFLRRIFPREKDKIFNIGEYVTGEIVDVQDPFGGQESIYKDVACILDTLVGDLLSKLKR